MKQIIMLLTFLTFLSSCAKKNKFSFGQFSPSNIQEQVFKVKLNTDTTLKTKSGVLLKISANTFQNTNLKEVEVKVKEIISKEDLLKSGVSTVDNKGKLLESGGMINIQTSPRLDINSNAPIQASIPVVGANIKMKKYTADIDNGDFLWKEAEPLTNNLDFNNLIQGEQLFIKHCANCHAKSLDAKLTGPELGCIEIGENSRSREWLINFTKNSQKMIAEGDKLAVCNWNTYKPTVMTSFEFLSDLQINQIYDYINNESIRRNICYKGEVYGRNYFDVPSCDNRSDTSYNPKYIPNNIKNTPTENIEKQESTKNEKFIQQEINFEKTNNGRVFTRTYYYTFTISDYKWINCDCNPFDEEEVDAYNIIAEKDLEIFLIFKNRKSLWSFCTWKERYVLIETEDEKKVKLPVGEPVTIFAFSKPKNGKRNYCEIQTEVKQTNDMTLTLSSVSEDGFQKILQRYK